MSHLPERNGNDRPALYWRIRIGLEFLKTGVWIMIQWFWRGGPFGPA